LFARIKPSREYAEAPILKALLDFCAFGFFPMSERQEDPYATIARKWLALAERRQQHLIELSASGRWKLYFSQVELETEMRKAALTRDQWVRVVRRLCGDMPERLAS
jgi:hypothetical protein